MTQQSKHLYKFGSHQVDIGSVSSCGQESAHPPSRKFGTWLVHTKEKKMLFSSVDLRKTGTDRSSR